MQTYFVLFSLLACFAAIFDFLFYKIPNIFCGLIAILFLLGSSIFYPVEKILHAFLLSGGTLGICFVLYLMRILGAGDAKFLTVSSLWAVDTNFLYFMLVTSACGGLLGLLYIMCSDKIDIIRIKLNLFLTKFFENSLMSAFYKRYGELPFKNSRSQDSGKIFLPYGVAICGGCIMITYINIWGS